MISQAEMHLRDAEDALESITDSTHDLNTDRLIALATASALTSIAASLAGGA